MDKQQEFRRELRNYIIGFVLALVLSAGSFWIVLSHEWRNPVTLCVIGILGVIQLLVHLRFFLHIDGKRETREDLYLILFSSLLFVLLVGGTIWIMSNLGTRMGMVM